MARRNLASFLIVSSILLGCDDKDGTEEDTSTDALDVEADAAEDTIEDVIDEGVSGDAVSEDVLEEEVIEGPSDLAFVYTVAADFSTGSYGVVDLGDSSASGDLDTMVPDGRALCLGDQVFMHELSGADSVDPVETVSPHAVVARHAVGTDMNPVDGVLVDATHMLAVLYGGSGLVELDLGSGDLGDEVDLSAFDDNDDVPEAHAIAHVGSYYYVSLQRLHEWAAVDAGLVVVVDDTTLDIVDVEPGTPSTTEAIPLPGHNPIGRFRRLGDDLYVALTGTWGSTDGGIAVVDTTAHTADWVVEGADLGGDPVFGDCFEIVDASTGYACVGLEDGSADAVVSFDPSSGTTSGSVITTTTGSLSGSALVPDGRMIVGDRDATSPGLRIVDTSSATELTTSPIEVGSHPPYSVCIHVRE